MYVIKVSRAAMRGNFFGKNRYVRVAVIEVPDGTDPSAVKIIRDTRTQSVLRVWEACYDGTSDRCGRARAEREARELIDRLTAHDAQEESGVES